MKTLFWTGKLSLPVRLLVNSNNVLAFFSGNSGNKTAMKERVRLGYEGKFTDHIQKYDNLAGYYQKRAAIAQLNETDCKDKEILDVGCGTGIMALLALDKGAKKVICGDISDYMLESAGKNASLTGYDPSRIQFCKFDAESIPFENESFDLVFSGMAFGLFPDQEKALSEMYRVLRKGGIISLGAHGPEHYWEAIDATIRVLNKKYVIGYRFEFWPRTEKEVHSLMQKIGFKDVFTNRFIWRNIFKDPIDACDFFATVSSSWWYCKIPREKRSRQYKKTQNYFNKNNIRMITDDVIIAFGTKN